MPQGIELYLGSLSVAAAIALGAWSGGDLLLATAAAIERDIAEKLRRLRASTEKLRAILVAWVGVTAVVFFIFWHVLASPVFAVLASAFLLAAPWYLLQRAAERRRQKVEDQMADAMVTLANAVRAGLSLVQSLDILAAQCPWPINEEFRQIIGEYKLGKPLERTLVEAKDRLRSENFALFAAAILASHESGGKLNETVERIAQSVLELQRLERKIMSETAQARKSAIYMACTPAFILVAYWFVDPDNTALLFTTTFGNVLLALALLLNIAAYWWARWILNPDI